MCFLQALVTSVFPVPVAKEAAGNAAKFALVEAIVVLHGASWRQKLAAEWKNKCAM